MYQSTKKENKRKVDAEKHLEQRTEHGMSEI